MGRADKLTALRHVFFSGRCSSTSTSLSSSSPISLDWMRRRRRIVRVSFKRLVSFLLRLCQRVLLLLLVLLCPSLRIAPTRELTDSLFPLLSITPQVSSRTSSRSTLLWPRPLSAPPPRSNGFLSVSRSGSTTRTSSTRRRLVRVFVQQL
jgi:hypothetical protein